MPSVLPGSVENNNYEGLCQNRYGYPGGYALDICGRCTVPSNAGESCVCNGVLNQPCINCPETPILTGLLICRLDLSGYISLPLDSDVIEQAFLEAPSTTPLSFGYYALYYPGLPAPRSLFDATPGMLDCFCIWNPVVQSTTSTAQPSTTVTSSPSSTMSTSSVTSESITSSSVSTDPPSTLSGLTSTTATSSITPTSTSTSMTSTSMTTTSMTSTSMTTTSSTTTTPLTTTIPVAPFASPVNVSMVQNTVNMVELVPFVMEGSASLNLSSFQIVIAPSNGEATINELGILTYTPNPNFLGMDSLVYQVCDISTPPLCAQSYVNYTVTSIPPVVNDSIVEVPENVENFEIVLNITIGSAPINYTGITILVPPSHGNITEINGTGVVFFTPDPGFLGSDFFIVRVCDTNDIPLCDTGIVNITVAGVGPTALPVTVTLLQNTEASTNIVNFVITGTRPIDMSSLSIATPPTNGNAFVNGSFIVYIPNPDFLGMDQLTYQICDVSDPPLCSSNVISYNVVAPTTTETPTTTVTPVCGGFGTSCSGACPVDGFICVEDNGVCGCKLECSQTSPLTCATGHCADGSQCALVNNACVCQIATTTISDPDLDLLIIIGVPIGVAVLGGVMALAFFMFKRVKEAGMKHKVKFS